MKDNFARSESHVEQGLIVPESLTEVLRGFLYLLLGAQAAAGEVSLVCRSVLSLLDGDSPSLPLVNVAGNRFPVAGPEPSKMPGSAWRARGKGGVKTLQVTVVCESHVCVCLCVK